MPNHSGTASCIVVMEAGWTEPWLALHSDANPRGIARAIRVRAL